jgi:RNA polymerase sigma-70 factor, ECF subfamily
MTPREYDCVMNSESTGITQLLIDWSNGDKTASDRLMPLVHAELKRLARRYMSRENPGHTLQTSALLNEAYIRLVDQQSVSWVNRTHFFAVAAQVMRHVLIDHARRHLYAKRGGGARHVSLEDAGAVNDRRAAELVALDDALKDLANLDPRKSQIIELRFFGGLSVEETAEALDISPITVTREWRSAKAWLHREMSTPKKI